VRDAAHGDRDDRRGGAPDDRHRRGDASARARRMGPLRMSDPNTRPRVLSIAGSDSGGGAGIQADLKTFSAFGVYGMTAVTAITAQNTLGVQAILELPVELISAQIESVAGDIGLDAAKTGMLSSYDIVQVVSDKIQDLGIERLVVDPVMIAKSGDALLQDDAVEAVRTRLLPLALVVTPNLPEAEVLTGLAIPNQEAM